MPCSQVSATLSNLQQLIKTTCMQRFRFCSLWEWSVERIPTGVWFWWLFLLPKPFPVCLSPWWWHLQGEQRCQCHWVVFWWGLAAEILGISHQWKSPCSPQSYRMRRIGELNQFLLACPVQWWSWIRGCVLQSIVSHRVTPPQGIHPISLSHMCGIQLCLH